MNNLRNTDRRIQIGVKIVIIDEEQMKFLALKKNIINSRFSFNNVIDIPGGRILFGEEPLEGLKREINEEIGIKLSNKPLLIHAGNIFLDQHTQIVRLTYMVNEKIEMKKIILSCEHSKAEFFKLKQNDFFHPLLNEAINECLIKLKS